MKRLRACIQGTLSINRKSVTGYYVLSEGPSVILGHEAEGSSLRFQA
jgi:hypothetical protein